VHLNRKISTVLHYGFQVRSTRNAPVFLPFPLRHTQACTCYSRAILVGLNVKRGHLGEVHLDIAWLHPGSGISSSVPPMQWKHIALMASFKLLGFCWDLRIQLASRGLGSLCVPSGLVYICLPPFLSCFMHFCIPPGSCIAIRSPPNRASLS